jgi:hypothetical protein
MLRSRRANQSTNQPANNSFNQPTKQTNNHPNQPTTFIQTTPIDRSYNISLIRPTTDARNQSKLACLLQQIKGACKPAVYAAAARAATDFRFPAAQQKEAVEGVVALVRAVALVFERCVIVQYKPS